MVSGLTIYIIKSKTEKCKTAYQFAKTSVFVGRPDPQNPDLKIDMLFKHDMRVSRKHALVRYKEGKWFIKDIGSKRGTIVNGMAVKPYEDFEINPLMPVLTGNTLWTIIPSNLLYINYQDVLLTAPCSKTLNYALFHCGMPVIDSLTIRNYGKEKSSPVTLEIAIPEYSTPCKIDIPAIAPEEIITIGAPPLELDSGKLRRQIEPAQAKLQISNNEKKIKKAVTLDILGFKAWAYEDYALKTIASFVSPHDGFIENIVSNAEFLVKKMSDYHSFSELLQSGRDDTERIILNIIYEYLKEYGNICYTYPESQSLHDRRQKYQIIKSAGSIFNHGHKTPGGKATCIDLAILMAGCLENTGILPIIFLIDNQAAKYSKGNNRFVPSHAFAGCWAGAIPGNQPLIDDVVFLQEEIKSQNMFVVECTGFAAGIDTEGKSDFKQAEQAAINQIDKNCQVRAVDIGALRPPNGSITPMEYSFEPEVVKIFQEAKLFAKRKKRKLIETVHLFYGILSARGKIISRLFKKCEKNISDILDALDRFEKPKDSANEPVPSKNFVLCRQLAEWYCINSSVSSVREQDIIWALIDNGQKSEHFKKACQKLDIDIKELSASLNKECPRALLLLETHYYS